MRLALHIFKKDVRRLWPGIAIALLVQAAAAWVDAVGATAVPAGVLLMITWATLLVLAVHEDPLVGDRQFWITRPGRWRVLLGAKLLFAVAVVHVPLLVADIVVLAARGFRPWEWVARLLTEQLLAAAVVTLPAIALAAVLRNFAHLALAVIAIAGLSALAANGTPESYGWLHAAETLVVLVTTVACAAAVVMIWWQFARRRTWASRLVGIAGVLVGALMWVFLPPIFLARVRAAANPAPSRISFHVRSGSTGSLDPITAMARGRALAGMTVMTVPLNVSGIPAGLASGFVVPTVDIIAPGHERYQAGATYLWQDWLITEIPLEFYQRLKDAKVELKGSAAAFLYRVGSTASLPLGVDRLVPGLGRCSSEAIESPGPEISYSRPHHFLKVECESPSASSLTGFVRLRRTGDPDAGGTELGSMAATGISILARASASFILDQGENPQSSWRLEITPNIPQGSQVVSFDLHDLRLGDYVQQPGEWRLRGTRDGAKGSK
ncbi:MAG TPA: hypothetical protein VHW09_20665 [Bryobacteraceae bacterium]|jgi:hypothetical protein|nr:hypothetical protein [Bryobacteraceae bacterium]